MPDSIFRQSFNVKQQTKIIRYESPLDAFYWKTTLIFTWYHRCQSQRWVGFTCNFLSRSRRSLACVKPSERNCNLLLLLTALCKSYCEPEVKQSIFLHINKISQHHSGVRVVIIWLRKVTIGEILIVFFLAEGEKNSLIDASWNHHLIRIKDNPTWPDVVFNGSVIDRLITSAVPRFGWPHHNYYSLC